MFLISDGSQSQQRFLVEPQAEVVRPGSNISLHCKIANMGDLSQCRWQKNRFPVGIFSGKYSIPENSRETGTWRYPPEWSTAVIIMLRRQLSYAIKNQLKAFLRWFFMA